MNLGGTIRLNRIGICVICGCLLILFIYLMPIEDSRMSLPVGKTINMRQLLVAAIEAAERGGKEIVKVRKSMNIKEKSKGKNKDGYNMPVTEADKKSHCVMFHGLTQRYAGLNVISEEHESDCGTVLPLEIVPNGDLGLHSLQDADEEFNLSKVTVWIDPLDATQEFTENLYDFVTTMVCVAYDGSPVIGVIHKPFGDEPRTTWSWRNKGRSPNLKEHSSDVDGKKVIVSRSHSGKEVNDQVKKIFGDNVEIVYAGGSGYKALELVSGNVTAYYHGGRISKWDICAADAIVTSVGGRFTTLKDEDIDYSFNSETVNNGGFLATLNGHSKYLEKIKEVIVGAS